MRTRSNTKTGAVVRRAMAAGLIGLLLGSGAVTTGCSTNPATGRRSLTLLSWDQERSLGAEAAPQMAQEFGGEVADEQLRAFTRRVGGSMIPHIESGVPELDWEFVMLDSDVINAFALPGGKVYITRELASRMTNEAQFAAVIGHEIGHVTARHGNQRISSQIGFNVLLAGLAIGVGVSDQDSSFRRYGEVGLPALAIGGNLVLLSYGRNEELEADMLGVRYMTGAGYDPIGALQVQELLGSLAGGERPPEFLSTHPHSETRIDAINRLLRGEYAHTQNNPEFRTYEDRYQREVLSRIRRRAADDGSFNLAHAASWCLHCAMAEAGQE